MPPKQAVEAKGPPSDSLLRYGKYDNVVSWNLEMRTSVGATYGMTAMFLTTDVRYVPPLPRPEDYTVVYPAAAAGEPEAVAVSKELAAKMKENYCGPLGSDTPFSLLDAISIFVPWCSYPRRQLAS